MRSLLVTALALVGASAACGGSTESTPPPRPDSGSRPASVDSGRGPPKPDAQADSASRTRDAGVESEAPVPTIDGGICTTNGQPFAGEGGICNGGLCPAGCECSQPGGSAVCDCTRAIPPPAGTFCVSTNCGSIVCGDSPICGCDDPTNGGDCYCTD